MPRTGQTISKGWDAKPPALNNLLSGSGVADGEYANCHAALYLHSYDTLLTMSLHNFANLSDLHWWRIHIHRENTAWINQY